MSDQYELPRRPSAGYRTPPEPAAAPPPGERTEGTAGFCGCPHCHDDGRACAVCGGGTWPEPPAPAEPPRAVTEAWHDYGRAAPVLLPPGDDEPPSLDDLTQAQEVAAILACWLAGDTCPSTPDTADDWLVAAMQEQVRTGTSHARAAASELSPSLSVGAPGTPTNRP